MAEDAIDPLSSGKEPRSRYPAHGLGRTERELCGDDKVARAAILGISRDFDLGNFDAGKSLVDASRSNSLSLSIGFPRLKLYPSRSLKVREARWHLSCGLDRHGTAVAEQIPETLR